MKDVYDENMVAIFETARHGALETASEALEVLLIDFRGVFTGHLGLSAC